MNMNQFRDLVRELRNAYGLTMYRGKQGEDSEVIDFLYDKCGNIPFESSAWVSEKVQQNHDKFPSKIHVAILWAYQEWLRANPKKAAFKEKVNCPDCLDGLLFMDKTNEMGHRVTHAFVCGRCKQSQLAYPCFTKLELLGKGYTEEIPLGSRQAAKNDTYKPGRLEGLFEPENMSKLMESAKERPRYADHD